ncbi:uncharacterized mitochondrial protein AtMg00810-like [Andrographis paniculata]|uniref:uncharacterized mitochondrial protein AtMg00810-like n=1 Tax=Andrographis paniculata TaxID=175694 RepID=UPI0021E7C8B6|nr:uncharacterized mitochondrial protein AtMg00810-like [Andrographis paniculata]
MPARFRDFICTTQEVQLPASFGEASQSQAWNSAMAEELDAMARNGKDEHRIVEIKQTLHEQFTIKDLGAASYYLGLELRRGNDGIRVSQSKFTNDLLEEFQVSQNFRAHTPLGTIKPLHRDSVLFSQPHLFRKLVGKLIYLGFSRTDLSFAVQQLSQFMHAPTEDHWLAATHILQYLRNTSSLGLFFPTRSPLELTGYCDSDWGNCLDTRRSLSGYCVFFGGTWIAWKTKKQQAVSKSSTEAEYRNIVVAISELLWIHYVLESLRVSVPRPIPLYCDNESAITLVADIFTKSLCAPLFLRHCGKLNLEGFACRGM